MKIRPSRPNPSIGGVLRPPEHGLAILRASSARVLPAEQVVPYGVRCWDIAAWEGTKAEKEARAAESARAPAVTTVFRYTVVGTAAVHP